jgi:DNA polymerase (family 10)
MAELSNAEIAELLDRHAGLLDVAGESAFRSRAYRRAAEAVRFHDEPIAVVAREHRLRSIAGVGQGIASSIEQILASGSFSDHEQLAKRVPETLAELLAIPGVGAKTALRLYSELGVTGLQDLETVLETGRIGTTKSLGKRLESTVRDGIEILRRRTGRMPLGIALPLARSLVSAYEVRRPEDHISIAGSTRRWEVTVGDLDFVVGTNEPERAMRALQALPLVVAAERIGSGTVQLSLPKGITAEVFLVEPSSWGTELVRSTGSAEHVAHLGPLDTNLASEQEVYAAVGMPWIPPELRAGTLEFERTDQLERLIDIADIRGEFHCHSTWSDGSASILEMASAAEARGYDFLGISDHSHGLGIAGGLDPERLRQQRQEIEEVNRRLPLKVLAGAEVEVHRDGSLDYDQSTLAGLDVVIASLHSGLRQPRPEITQRSLRTIDNRNVDIIAHPSGRLIEQREGGDFDWTQVFADAARTGTAMEINADPARLDLDPHLARRAADAGCLITVNCDAHSPAGFELMEYGVAMARKAWLRPLDVLNCWQTDEVMEWLSSRKSPGDS